MCDEITQLVVASHSLVPVRLCFDHLCKQHAILLPVNGNLETLNKACILSASRPPLLSPALPLPSTLSD